MATEITLKVEGMTCDGCETSVQNALKRLDGEIVADADSERGEVKVRFDDARVDIDALEDCVVSIGYDV